MGFLSELMGNFWSWDFTTEKSLCIHDPRLGALHSTMRALIAVYIGMFMVWGQAWVSFETPVGRAALWGDGDASIVGPANWGKDGPCSETCHNDTSRDYYEQNVGKFNQYAQQALFEGATDYKYCSTVYGDASDVYNFSYSDNGKKMWGPFYCHYAQPADVVSWAEESESSSFKISLMEQRTIIRSFVASQSEDYPMPSSDEDCNAIFVEHGISHDGACGYPGAHWFAGMACRCEDKVSTFNVEAEHLSVYVQHGFKSSWSNPTASGFLPETVVRIGGKDRLLFRSGEVVQLSVPWLLNEMGIDLDTDECIDQASSSRSTKYRGGETDANNEGRCPRGRVSGAKFKLLFSYYNYNKQHQSSFSIPGSGKTPAAAVVDIEATLQWTELQNAKTWVPATWAQDTNATFPWTTTASQYNVATRYGIEFEYDGDHGQVGALSFAVLLSALVQAAVMLSFASTVTLYVAKNCLGLESQLYSAVMEEDLSFSKEVARFVSRALIAQSTFEKMDADGGGELCVEEIGDVLRKFASDLSASEVDLCAELLVEAAEYDARAEGRPVAVGHICPTGFAALASDGRLTPTVLRDVLEKAGKARGAGSESSTRGSEAVGRMSIIASRMRAATVGRSMVRPRASGIGALRSRSKDNVEMGAVLRSRSNDDAAMGDVLRSYGASVSFANPMAAGGGGDDAGREAGLSDSVVALAEALGTRPSAVARSKGRRK